MISKIKKILNKKNKSKIICLTSYSKNISEAIDPYSDIILVGDSLGSVLYNYSTTRKVTLDQMIEHSKSARLGIKNSLMVVDMPYRTYEYICLLRAITSEDGMTADFFNFKKKFMQLVSNKIINNIRGINRVVYDLSLIHISEPTRPY